MTPNVRQLKAARILLGWSQAELASKAKVGRNSLSRFESGMTDTKNSTIQALTSALQKGGIIFVSEASRVGIWLNLGEADIKSAAPDHPSDIPVGGGTSKSSTPKRKAKS
jgi:transcriptional regulator with XRE-family HTH domain